MLMRSHSPIHGVGRFACRRGASRNVNPPNTSSTTIVTIEYPNHRSIEQRRGDTADEQGLARCLPVAGKRTVLFDGGRQAVSEHHSLMEGAFAVPARQQAAPARIEDVCPVSATEVQVRRRKIPNPDEFFRLRIATITEHYMVEQPRR